MKSPHLLLGLVLALCSAGHASGNDDQQVFNTHDGDSSEATSSAQMGDGGILPSDTSAAEDNPFLSASHPLRAQLLSGLAGQMSTCMESVPSHHGIYLQVTDSPNECEHLKEEEAHRSANDDDDEDEEQQTQLSRRFLRALHRTWKGMPFDQRVATLSTVLGAAIVPLYLVGAGTAYDEYEVSNLKEQLLRLKRNDPEGNTTQHRLTMTPPTVPYSAPITAGNRKRGIAESAVDEFLVRRAVLEDLPHENIKTPNATVGRMLALTGFATAVLYVPSAVVAGLRSLTVRDGDTAAYKRSVLGDLKGITITCYPVEEHDGLHTSKDDTAFYIDKPEESVEAADQPSNLQFLTNMHLGIATPSQLLLQVSPRSASEEQLSFDRRSVSTATEEPEIAFAKRQNPEAKHPETTVHRETHLYNVQHDGKPGGDPFSSMHGTGNKKGTRFDTKKALAVGLVATAGGYIAHSLYAGQQQQQQPPPMPYPPASNPYMLSAADQEYLNSIPVSKRDVDDALGHRDSSKSPLSGKDATTEDNTVLQKRSPEGPAKEYKRPDVTEVHHKYVHHNVHPSEIDYYRAKYGGGGVPDQAGKPQPLEEGRLPTDPQGGGDHYTKEVTARGARQKKSLSGTYATMIALGGLTLGALGHATFMGPSQPPPAPYPPYYDPSAMYPGGPGVAAYRKRELREDIPDDKSVAHKDALPAPRELASQTVSGAGNTKKDEISEHLLRRSLTYDDEVRALKIAAEQKAQANGDAEGVPLTDADHRGSSVVQNKKESPSTPLRTPEYEEEPDEEDKSALKRRCHGGRPPMNSYNGQQGDDEFYRRDIEYTQNSDGSIRFDAKNATKQVSQAGEPAEILRQSQDRDDETQMKRRALRDLMVDADSSLCRRENTVNYYHTADGGLNFSATSSESGHHSSHHGENYVDDEDNYEGGDIVRREEIEYVTDEEGTTSFHSHDDKPSGFEVKAGVDGKTHAVTFSVNPKEELQPEIDHAKARRSFFSPDR